MSRKNKIEYFLFDELMCGDLYGLVFNYLNKYIMLPIRVSEKEYNPKANNDY